MKAKKLLALLLTVLLIGGMLPTAFAEGEVAEGEEPISVTFNFAKGGKNGITNSWLERYTWTSADSVDTSTIKIEQNSNLTPFPSTSENANEQWAYVGSGVMQNMTYTAPTAGASNIINVYDNYVGTNTSGEDAWIAYKIKVPKTAYYEISDFSTYAYQNATSELHMYITPSTSEFDAVVTAAKSSATGFSIYEGSGSYAGKVLIHRNGYTPFTSLGVYEDSFMGKVNERVAKADRGDKNLEVIEKNKKKLEEGKEYYLFFYSKESACITYKTVTLTEVEASIEDTDIYAPEYNFTKAAITDTSIKLIYDMKDSSKLNRVISTGAWVSHAATSISNSAILSDGAQFCGYKSNVLGGHSFLVLKLSVDVPGYYSPKIAFEKKDYCGLLDFWAVPVSVATENGWTLQDSAELKEVAAESEKLDSGVGYIASVDTHSVSSEVSPFTGNPVYFEEDTYLVIRIRKGSGVSSHEKETYYGYLNSVKLVPSDAFLDIAISDNTFRVGKSSEITAVAKNADGSAAEISEITYENLTPSVVSLSGNTVTALAEGEAVIKATATVDGVTVTDTIRITVSPKQVSIATDIAGVYSVKQYAVGSDVTITAPALTGKTFRYWVRGTEATGLPVSESASYTFKAVTKAYYTAVYSENAAEDAKVVEFYAENGAYIGNAVANEEGKVTLPTTPSLTGYVFNSWRIDAATEFTADTIVDAFLTKVVATYEAAKIGDKSYGDEVKNEASSAKVWKRDGKIVSYGTEYTYYVWAESEITSEDGEKPATPIIVLDSRGKEGNARMIEYDANGFEIVEAGILFGNGTEMSVESCMYKAASKINANHGQFTAKPFNEEYTTARGYIVYKDNGEYKVVYSH